jgi:hypothetical protein
MDTTADPQAKIRGSLDDALSNLMAVLPGADNEPGWDLPTDEEGWTVRQTLAHLMISEASMQTLIARALEAAATSQPVGPPAAGPDGQPFDLHKWNRRQVDKQAATPPSALRVARTETRAKTLRDLKATTPEQLATAAWHPALGDTTVEGIYRIIGIHMRDHTRVLKKALRSGLAGRYWADSE